MSAADSFPAPQQDGPSMPEASRADLYGSRARIGYTSPPMTTEVFPYEFYKVVPDGVTLVLTTLRIGRYTQDEVSESWDISLRAARAMARAKVTAIILGGGPINLSHGYAGLTDA